MFSHRASRTPHSGFSSNIPLLNIFAFLKMALFPMAIITIFWKEQIGLTLTEILILQAIFSVATLLMEYPSGYLSDRLGYRFSLQLASLLGISGWITYTLAGSFFTVMLAEIQLGISYAFISGADSALLFETLRQDNREEDYTRHDGRMTAWAQAGEACGAVFAGFLYTFLPLLPFLIQVGVWIAALAVCRNLREVPSTEPLQPTESHLKEACRIARHALVESKGLRWTLLLAAVLNLASFYPVWLIQPYMQLQGVPLSWFGPIWALANLAVSFGSMLSHRCLFHLGHRGMALLCLGLVLCGYLGLGWTASIWSFAFYYLLTVMRGLQGPFLRYGLQQQSRRPERASILSLKSLLFRLGFTITGPLIGLFADARGLPQTFQVTGLIFAVVIGLTALQFSRATHSIWPAFDQR